MNKNCKVENCTRQAQAQDMCLVHYKRVKRHGDPSYGTAKYRFLHNIEKTDYCWIWKGKARCGKNRGYGQFSVNNKSVEVHRFSYQFFNGEIPAQMHVLHHCDNPICVNPKHLFLGTNLDNIRDKISKGRWKGGHPKFVPKLCPRCQRTKQLVKGYCKGCYTTVRRQVMGRGVRGESPF